MFGVLTVFILVGGLVVGDKNPEFKAQVSVGATKLERAVCSMKPVNCGVVK